MSSCCRPNSSTSVSKEVTGAAPLSLSRLASTTACRVCSTVSYNARYKCTTTNLHKHDCEFLHQSRFALLTSADAATCVAGTERSGISMAMSIAALESMMSSMTSVEKSSFHVRTTSKRNGRVPCFATWTVDSADLRASRTSSPNPCFGAEPKMAARNNRFGL